MREGTVNDIVSQYVPPGSVEEQWDVPSLEKALLAELTMQVPIQQWLKEDESLDEEDLRRKAIEAAHAHYDAKLGHVEREALHDFERAMMLQTLDTHWREHLSNLDHLRQGIHLRGYAQKNPKQEYKREAFELFSDMLDRIKHDVVKIMLTVQVRTQQDVQAVEEPVPVTNVRYQHADYEEALGNGNGGNGDGDTAVATAPPKAVPFS